MTDRKFAEAPEITIQTLAEFDAAIARIAHLEAEVRDPVTELQLAALLEAADAYIRTHAPRHESRDFDQRPERP